MKAQPRTIERDIRKSSLIGVGLIGILTVCLLLMQAALGKQISAQAGGVALSSAMAELQHSFSGLYARQSRLASTTHSRELAAVPAREPLERRLEESLRLIGELAPRRIGVLRDRVDAFLVADERLERDLRAEHELSEELVLRDEQLEAELRTLIESAGGIAGVARLDTMLYLRRLQANPGSRELAREAVFGSGRVQMDAASRIVVAALQLGVLAGKIGLAHDGDALRNLVANQIPQMAYSSEAAFAAWRHSTRSPEALQQIDGLQERWQQVLRHIIDDSLPSSLAALRRKTLEQQRRAVEVGAADAAESELLHALLRRIDAEVRASVDRTRSQTSVVLWVSRIVTALVIFFGAFAMSTGRRRIDVSLRALRTQNRELQQLRDSLEDINSTLEGQVERRTAALATREASMRLILDSTGDGLVYLSAGGTVLGELSRSMQMWFGTAKEGVKIHDYLFPDDEGTASEVELGFEQFSAGLLPTELIADQMVRRIERDERIYGLSWKPVLNGSELRGVLLVVTDDTAAEANERAALRSAEMQISVGLILRDQAGFIEFIQEGEALLHQIRNGSARQSAVRALHTLKGNSATMGFGDVAREAHQLEESLVDEAREVTRRDMAPVIEAWSRCTADIQGYLQSAQMPIADTKDVEFLKRSLRQGAPHEEILKKVQSWQYTRTSAYLERLAGQAEAVGRRLGRPVDVQISADDTRAAYEVGPFFSSLIHVVRNAIDHGIEAPELRAKDGKPSVGKLRFSSKAGTGGTLCVEISDDGAGIDWEKLRSRAAAKGLRAANDNDLLFLDGVSSQNEVTAISGRGVGLAAVREIVDELGGNVQVESDVGKGTTFRFKLPGLVA